MQQGRAELAIVVPAKNEAAHLPRLLTSLCAQDYAAMPATSVIVADAHSTDGTAALALEFSDRLNVQVIEGGMPSVGRNRGAMYAGAELVLFLDADVVLHDRTLVRRAVDAVRRRRLYCATVDIACEGGRWTDRMLYRANNGMQHLSSWFLPFGTGMFLLCEAKRFRELGGFDESALFAEDFLFTKQISPLRFAVVPGEVHTSNRRFRRTGQFRMVWLFWWTLLNHRNHAHFQRDHNYWKPAVDA